MINKKRKEVHLSSEVIEKLKIKAKNQGRSLKNYMEFVLLQHSMEFEITEEYKSMTDSMLVAEMDGTAEYISLEDVKKKYKL